jgi:hypothetical protein
MYKIDILKKMLVIGIFVLFLGVSGVSAININVESTNVIDDVVTPIDALKTFYPTDDAYIKHSVPNGNGGSHEYFNVRNEYGGTGGGLEYAGLIKFDISSLPSDATINSATLSIYYFDYWDMNPVGRDIHLYRATSDWDEMTVTWNNQPPYEPHNPAYTPVPSSFGWMTWDVTNDIQDFVNGQETNYGWKVIDDNYWGWFEIPTARFRTKEYGSDTPQLEIDYKTSRDAELGFKILEETTHPENLIPTDIFNPTDDTYVKHNKPTLPGGGTHPYMSIRNEYGIYGSSGFAWHGHIKFDLSSVPPVDFTATLNMYYYSYQDTNPAGRPLALYRALSDWDEITLSWNTQPPYPAQPSTFSLVPGSYGWMTWDVTSDVQDFVNGVETNYGWKIADEMYWGMPYIPTTRFRTNDYGSLIPYLEIEIETTSDPPYTPTIDGPTSGELGVSYTYSTSTTDPDGDQIIYLFDWGDGTNSGWIGPYDSGATVYESHIWYEPGTFPVKVKASDINGASSGWSNPLMVTLTNEPPYTPTLDGSTSGKVGVSYVYSTSTTDPDGHQINYFFDWGDGTNSGWIGPYNSGTTQYKSHIWNDPGSFVIQVKSKDIYNLESEWSDPIIITLTKNKAINSPFLNWLQSHPNMFPILQQFLQHLG